MEADDAEGEAAVTDAATAAALNGDGLVGSGPPGPDISSGPPALLTGVTLLRPMLLTPLLLKKEDQVEDGLAEAQGRGQRGRTATHL